MYYLWNKFGNPLMFMDVQSAFGTGRQTDTIIMLPQVFYRYFSILTTVSPQNYIYYPIVQELIIAIATIAAIIWGFKKIRPSYTFFIAASLIIPSLTGTFTSLPRYMLPVFPLFLIMALYLGHKAYRLWLAISAILLIINTALFIQGWWIA